MWLVYTLLSILCFGVLTVLQRTIAVDSKNHRASAVVFNLISTSLALTIFFTKGSQSTVTFPHTWLPYVFLIIGALGYGLFERLRFKSANAVSSSEFAIISNLAVAIAFIASFYLYHESVTAIKIFATVLILISTLLVTWQRGTRFIKKGSAIAIISITILGIAMSLDKMGAANFQPDLYNIFVWSLPLFIVILPPIKLKYIIRELKSGSWKIFTLSIINVLGYYFSLKALSLTEATRFIPISQTSTLVAVILGIALLKETKNLKRKITAITLALLGVFLLSF